MNSFHGTDKDKYEKLRKSLKNNPDRIQRIHNIQKQELEHPTEANN